MIFPFSELKSRLRLLYVNKLNEIYNQYLQKLLVADVILLKVEKKTRQFLK